MSADPLHDDLLDVPPAVAGRLWTLRLSGAVLFLVLLGTAASAIRSWALLVEPVSLLLVVGGTMALGVVSFTPEQWRTTWRCVIQPNGQRSCGERRLAAGIFRITAAYAIGVGAIAVMLGMIQMLANFDDPSRMGPGMAKVLLSCLYGGVLAMLLVVAGTVASSSSDWTATISSRSMKPTGLAAGAAAAAVGAAIVVFFIALWSLQQSSV